MDELTEGEKKYATLQRYGKSKSQWQQHEEGKEYYQGYKKAGQSNSVK